MHESLGKYDGGPGCGGELHGAVGDPLAVLHLRRHGEASFVATGDIPEAAFAVGNIVESPDHGQQAAEDASIPDGVGEGRIVRCASIVKRRLLDSSPELHRVLMLQVELTVIRI